MTAEVTRFGALDMQVCVPREWTDDQVRAFAEGEYPCGTENGWAIRDKEGELPTYSCRVPCARREGHVHIVLDA
jgi:hypothetical protein